MIHTDNVFSYGFTQFEEECIRKLLPTKKSYLTSTECFTDIIACNSYAIFINTMMVSADDLEMLGNFILKLVQSRKRLSWLDMQRFPNN